MKKSVLVELIGSFSPKEIKEFSEFIRSPFFNKNKNVVKLYEEIVKAAGDAEKLEKEYLYKKIYGKAEYNDATVRTLMFNLVKLAEDYLAYKEFSEDGTEISLLKQLNKRGLKRSFEKSFKTAAGELEKLPVKDSDYYYKKYMLSIQHELYNIKSLRYLTSRDKPEDEIMKQSEYLTVFFLINLIRHYRFLLNRKLSMNIDINLHFLRELLSYLKDNPHEDIPSLNSGYHTLMLLLHEREEDFFKVKNYLFNNKHLFSREELYNFLIALHNFCVKAHHKGKESFLRESFELYKFMLENELYSFEEGGVMPTGYYKNIASIGLKLREYEWTEKFINEFREKLPPEKRENAYNLACSKLYFETKRFNEALETLSRVQNEDVYYKMEIKQTLLKIYYELGMYNEALDVCDTFRHLFTNNKIISEFHAEGAMNFIKLFGRLVRLKISGAEERADILKADTQSLNYLIGREWLLEKIEEPGNKKGG
jgi:hypothetical protein